MEKKKQVKIVLLGYFMNKQLQYQINNNIKNVQISKANRSGWMLHYTKWLKFLSGGQKFISMCLNS